MTSQPGIKQLKYTYYLIPKKVIRQPNNEIWSGNRKQRGKWFSSKIMQKRRWKTSSRPLFVFSKEVRALQETYNKTELYKTLDCWFRKILNFGFLKQHVRLDSIPHFVYDFWKKIFLKGRIHCEIFLSEYLMKY